jgi:osmotically-inducible protein OsmY
LKAKRAAAQDARNVVGVWGIKNQIKVRSDTDMPSDSQIKKSVEQALLYDPYLDRYEMSIKVVDGEVYLSGDVTSLFEKAQADDVVSRQQGVVTVHNRLDINEFDAMNYDPFSDTWYVYDYEWYNDSLLTNNLSDWQIKRGVADQMFWSPYLNRNEIDIAVDDGVVTLKGEVDTWVEYNKAREESFEGGAIGVDNNLVVEYAPDLYQQ